LNTRTTVLAVTALITLCALLAPAAAAAPAPDEAGPYATAQFETPLRDEARNRSIDLLVIYPLGADGRPLECRPLIVFNHGFLLSAQGYRSYGEHLASHGFVVALPTFPMTFLNVHHARLAEDVHFAIDTLLAATDEATHPLAGLIDPSRIGTAGHSLGGKLSLLEAVDDERVRACAVLDPVDEGNPLFKDPVRYPSVAPELMPELHVPLLIVGAELGSKLVFFSPCAPEDENYQRFFEAANPPAIEITQLDVGHGQYVAAGAASASDPCAVGDVPSEWVRSSSAAYLTAFFLGTLLDADGALAWLDARLAQDEADGRITVRRK